MKKDRLLLFIGLFFLTVVLADLSVWFSVTGTGDSLAETRQRYLSVYPEPLQNGRLLTVISLLLLTLSGFIFLTKARSRGIKVAASVLGLLCAVLMMWKIISLSRM